MNTIEGNKLIAKFMGINTKVYSDTPTITRWQFGNSMLHQDDLEYHSSWDWQIPAWTKLLSLTRERYYNETKRGASTSWSEQRDIWENNYHSAIDSASPKNGFDILVLAIQWYNENKTL